MRWESLREQGMAGAGLRAAHEGLVGRKGRTLRLSASAGGTPRWGVLAVLQFGEGVRSSDLKPCRVVKCIFDIQKLRGMGLVHPVFPQTQMTKSLITTSFCDFLSLKM